MPVSSGVSFAPLRAQANWHTMIAGFPRSSMPDDDNRPARVLVVDDQVDNLQAVGLMLGDHGYKIVLAKGAGEAFEHLEREGADLILLDVLMPGCDGLETCRRIRARPEWAAVPIIFLSAADDTDLIVQALEVGGVDYVVKPFNHAELVSRVRTHLALKLARDQLGQLAEDKDELLGILAHDLKNHLGGMCMSAKLLRDRALARDDGRLARMADNVLRSSEQMRDFVMEFLANAAADRGLRLRLEPVCLHQVSAAAVRQHAEAAARKGIKLCHLGQANGSVAADRRALGQVLDNLISNAVKFSPPGKTVRVIVGHDAGGNGSCRVEDEGPGFTDEDRKQMFRRYRRLSARPTDGEPSTGLGLSIVRSLVQAMRGDLRFETEPGRGASFTVVLPPAPPEA